MQLLTDPVIKSAKEENGVILVQNVLANTSHVTSWIAMLKDVIRVAFEDTKGAIRIRISKMKR